MGLIRIAQRRRWHPRIAVGRRLLGLLMLPVLVFSLFAAGRSYLWCVPMQRVMASCCHAPAPGDAATASALGRASLPAEIRGLCCETHDVGKLPQVRSQQSVTEIPAALVTVAPLAGLAAFAPAAEPSFHARAFIPRQRLHLPARAGPSSASAACARLQVFRC